MADGDPVLETILTGDHSLAIPVIVLGEYGYGIAQSRERPRYERWLNALVRDCRVLRVDEGTAVAYATIRGELKQAGRPMPANDAWIAALARPHAMAVISRDEHFDFVPNLKRVTW
jgi:predicted nucleic acid-binding protein